MKKVTFFSLGFSYTLPRTIYDSYPYKKITSSEKDRLASRGDLVPFQSFKQNWGRGATKKKTKAVVFCPDMRNKS